MLTATADAEAPSEVHGAGAKAQEEVLPSPATDPDPALSLVSEELTRLEDLLQRALAQFSSSRDLLVEERSDAQLEVSLRRVSMDLRDLESLLQRATQEVASDPPQDSKLQGLEARLMHLVTELVRKEMQKPEIAEPLLAQAASPSQLSAEEVKRIQEFLKDAKDRRLEDLQEVVASQKRDVKKLQEDFVLIQKAGLSPAEVPGQECSVVDAALQDKLVANLKRFEELAEQLCKDCQAQEERVNLELPATGVVQDVEVLAGKLRKDLEEKHKELQELCDKSGAYLAQSNDLATQLTEKLCNLEQLLLEKGAGPAAEVPDFQDRCGDIQAFDTSRSSLAVQRLEEKTSALSAELEGMLKRVADLEQAQKESAASSQAQSSIAAEAALEGIHAHAPRPDELWPEVGDLLSQMEDVKQRLATLEAQIGALEEIKKQLGSLEDKKAAADEAALTRAGSSEQQLLERLRGELLAAIPGIQELRSELSSLRSAPEDLELRRSVEQAKHRLEQLEHQAQSLRESTASLSALKRSDQATREYIHKLTSEQAELLREEFKSQLLQVEEKIQLEERMAELQDQLSVIIQEELGRLPEAAEASHLQLLQEDIAQLREAHERAVKELDRLDNKAAQAEASIAAVQADLQQACTEVKVKDLQNQRIEGLRLEMEASASAASTGWQDRVLSLGSQLKVAQEATEKAAALAAEASLQSRKVAEETASFVAKQASEDLVLPLRRELDAVRRSAQAELDQFQKTLKEALATAANAWEKALEAEEKARVAAAAAAKAKGPDAAEMDLPQRVAGLRGEVQIQIIEKLRQSGEWQLRRVAQAEESLRVLAAEHGGLEQRLQKRLERSLEDRLGELPSSGGHPSVEEYLSQLAASIARLAQFIGITSEDACARLGWKQACNDLPRMMDHAWLRSRLPRKTSLLAIVRAKAEAEHLRDLEAKVDALAMSSTFPDHSPARPLRPRSAGPRNHQASQPTLAWTTTVSSSQPTIPRQPRPPVVHRSPLVNRVSPSATLEEAHGSSS